MSLLSWLKRINVVLSNISRFSVVLLIVFLVIQVANARVWIIPDDYPTINQAIIAASEGDIIKVKSGVYNENILVDKSIELVGESPNNTRITGKITIEASNVKISKFNLDGNIMIKGCNCEIKENIINLGIGISGNNNIISRNKIINIKGWGYIAISGNNNILGKNCISSYFITIGYDYYSQRLIPSSDNRMENNEFINATVLVIGNKNYVCKNLFEGKYYFSDPSFTNEPFPLLCILLLGRENKIIGNTIINYSYGVTTSIPSVLLNYECWKGVDAALMKLGAPKYGNDNIIALNTFINNAYDAIDNGKNNKWYDERLKVGNYWEKWAEPDRNGDRIVDNPYVIPGNARTTDKYPLVSLPSPELIDKALKPSIFSQVDTSQKKSPGFEILAVIIALVVIILKGRNGRN